MTFYRDFCLERLAKCEEQLIGAAELFEVDTDDELDLEKALGALAQLETNARLVSDTLRTFTAAKVYKLGQTYHASDEAAKDDVQEAATSLAEIGEIMVGKSFGSHAIANVSSGSVTANKLYPRVASQVPIIDISRIGPHGLFNGALYEDEQRSLYSCRTFNFPSTTLLYDPRRDYLFQNPEPVCLPPGIEGDSVEDMRIFSHRGVTMCSFHVAKRGAAGWWSQMHLAEIGKDRKLTRITPLPSPSNAMVEKNWVFFSHESGLFFVYWPAPHMVYEVKTPFTSPEIGDYTSAQNWTKAKLLENPRGGCPPVRVGDEYYHFYHTQHRHGQRTAYQVGLYTFAAEAPWNLKRQMAAPLLSIVPTKRQVDVIFPCGAFLKNGVWHLSCGIHDEETVVICLGFDDIESQLEMVE